MNRRTFNKIVGIGSISSAVTRTQAQEQPSSPGRSTKEPVMGSKEPYRRWLMDMHVPDWDPQLMARLDPEAYVGAVAQAGFQSLLTQAKSHVGLCYYRTKLGRMHANMKGRDYFGEVLAACRRHGLHTRAYYSVMFDNWACEDHPDWRILPAGGYDEILDRRYGSVCPNSPYREYTLASLRELVGNYDFDAIWLDMNFWPTVCYCPHCTARFRREHEAEPPTIVDWDDPTWRNFLKARQQWLLEFHEVITRTIRETRSISVVHQSALLFTGWTLGWPLEITDTTDYLSGDYYGGLAQYSLVCKAYQGLTRTRPFEFITSRTPHPSEHVTTKPLDRLRIESFVPTLHSASLLLFDAVNPDGTFIPAVFDYLGKITAELALYEPFLGGDQLADVAIYYDKESMYDPDAKGVDLSKTGTPQWGGGATPHLDALLGLSRILREGHIPFGVVTNANLDQVRNYRAVMLPNVLEMTSQQAAQFRSFVQNGGVLYASGPSSLDRFDPKGPRFLLEDVLGVQYAGHLGTKVTYLTPKDDNTKKAIWPQDELTFAGPMVQARALPGSEVLAMVTLPFVAPEVGHVIGSRFAVIHSNPPAFTPGTDPGLVINRFGKGRAAWIAAPIETSSESVNAKLILSLLKRILPGAYHFEADTHPRVEMTLFHQTEKKQLLAGLLNLQEQLPLSPVGATVRVQLPPGRRATKVARVPEGKGIPFEKVGPYVQFRLEPFEALAMAIVEYQ